MVQGNGGPDNQPTNPQVDIETEQVVSETPAPTHQQAFIEQHGPQQVAQLSSHGTGQHITLTAAPIGGTVNVIATQFPTSTASGISSSGSAPTTPSNAGTTYQHYLIPNVSLGGQLQNITIPAQVALSSIRGANVTQTQAVVSSPTSTYTINSPQNLARILAAATQNYSVHGRGNITTVMASQQQQAQQLQGQPAISAAQVASVQLQKSAGPAGSTVLTMPGSPVSIQQQALHQQQRIGENVAVRITPTQMSQGLTGQSQTLLLDSLGGVHIQPGDVTKVHSYSVSKAVTMTNAPGGGMVAVSSLPVGPVTVTSPQQKVMCHIPQRVLTQKQCAGNPVSTNLVLQGINIQSPAGLASNTAMVVCSGSSGLTRTGNPQGASSAPKPKRIKLEERPPATEEIAAMRRKICDHRLVQFKNNKENYVEFLTELFFLQNGGNMMDYLGWKRRLTPQLLAFLKAHALDSDDEEEHRNLLLQQAARALANTPQAPPVTLALATPTVDVNAGIVSPASKSLSGSTPSSQPTSKHPSTTVPSLPTSISSSIPGGHAPVPLPPAVGQTSVTPSSSPSLPTRSPANSTAQKCAKIASLFTSNRLPVTRQHSISAVYDSSIGSQEEIVERAKQEAYVIQRISELRREGLWSSKRLPKVQEQPRAKAHWDYLLEEMTWLATDFAQERKWKKAAAKKCARMVIKYHQEREQKAEKAEKEEQLRLRRIATQVAKEIKQFWTNIEKLVEYKQQTRLDEKRKRALDLHLNFIVDQTEKYSSWLTQGMSKVKDEDDLSFTSQTPSGTITKDSTAESSPDEEFEPEPMESDDEETIAKAEEEEKGLDQDLEVSMLQQESEVPLDKLLQNLPPEIRDQRAPTFDPSSSSSAVVVKQEVEEQVQESEQTTKKEEVSEEVGVDEEYRASGEEDEEDDEATIAAAEKEDKKEKVDYSGELTDLQKESEMSLEELYEKYAGAYASDFHASDSSESEDIDTEDEEVDVVGDSDDFSMSTGGEEESEEEEMSKGSDEEVEQVGMEYLVSGSTSAQEDQDKNQEDKQDLQNSSASGEDKKGPTKEITDIAAAALSFQPKGNTLSTTQVCTKVPFLLKHTLREYQHIGLDWLVAMQDKKLNGILADEMGLGKTIQTIALLAHMACEKGTWGPHLIVVPTSVMLNWEMEFKKWCPGFKILTYYGSQKDRKKKREGWTKPNTFHICITSYKLVIQDHMAFRRKRWKYFILDEAHHIKNFKSQRWQMLLNFQSARRLLLTGTPLQNSLLELWSLMHFLMPNVFQSHREFREWFVNPVTGMIEGNHEYNENLIKRLHKILRPFLLRRLKCDVEKQLPKKYEHVIMCRLSTRQRYLYEDFMSQAKTRETLMGGNFLSVINVLMQLRKVCNHPNLFEARPTVSPFRMEGIVHTTASCVPGLLDYKPFEHVNLGALNLWLCDLSQNLTAFAAHRIRKFLTPTRFIEEIDNLGDPPPKCPPGKIRLHIRTSSSVTQQQNPSGMSTPPQAASPGAAAGFLTALVTPNRTSNLINTGGAPLTSPLVAVANTAQQSSFVNPQQRILVMGNQNAVAQGAVTAAAAGSEYSVQLLPQAGNAGQSGSQLSMAQLTSLGVRVSPMVSSTPITVQVQQGGQGGAKVSLPLGIGRIVQTSSGQHILLTSSPKAVPNADGSTPPVILSSTAGNSQALPIVIPHANKVSLPQSISLASPATSTGNSNKPVLRVAPLSAPPSTSSHNALGNASSTGASVASPQVTQETAKEFPPEHSKEKAPIKSRSIFSMETLLEKRKEMRRSKLRSIAKNNLFHCMACPIYGQDLIETVTVTNSCRLHSQSWQGQGYVHCLNNVQGKTGMGSATRALSSLLYTPESRMEQLKEVINRFVFVVPVVTAPAIQLRLFHPSPSRIVQERARKEKMQRDLSPKCAFLHPIIQGMSTQFPELRLIQYDCGKLQTLDKLLWQLKMGGHRVLIFTQMTRMLDILEQFLNFHGHTYLRLDGATRVDQRQVLMERFNADPRVFCFILSTRSGGIGINLTGADTVIFYDSDWNPTMDAQAQDRCHRIGQTRDVHIYRLISERTVEENILKKANQKRLLGDVAIEGGNFTTAFFKKNAIHELFGLTLAGESEAKKLIAASPKVQEELQPDVSQVQLEQALGLAEEDLDVQAAKTAKAEAAAELAEFDESIPLDAENSRDNAEEKSQAEEELDKLMEQLTPVEKYAMVFLESTQEPFTMEQLKQAEEEIEAQKKDWELGRLKALKEEEERRVAQLEEEEEPALTYSREDATNQVEKKSRTSRRHSKTPTGLGSKESRATRRKTRHSSQGGSAGPTGQKSPEVNGLPELNQAKPSNGEGQLPTLTDVPASVPGDRENCLGTKQGSLTKTGLNNSRVDGEIVSTPLSRRKSGDGAASPLLKTPQPFSNPNLVIRTRRARKIENCVDKNVNCVKGILSDAVEPSTSYNVLTEGKNIQFQIITNLTTCSVDQINGV